MSTEYSPETNVFVVCEMCGSVRASLVDDIVFTRYKNGSCCATNMCPQTDDVFVSCKSVLLSHVPLVSDTGRLPHVLKNTPTTNSEPALRLT